MPLSTPRAVSLLVIAGRLTVILRRNLLYFFSSKRSDVFFRFCSHHHGHFSPTCWQRVHDFQLKDLCRLNLTLEHLRTYK